MFDIMVCTASNHLSSICAVSVAASNYWPQIRVLADSLGKFHPDWILHVLLIDVDRGEECAQFESQEPNVRVWTLNRLGFPCCDVLSARYNITELCTAVKPRLLKQVLLDTAAEKLFYLDPDLMFFSGMDDAVSQLDRAALIFTPHFLSPEDAVSIEDEITYLRIGTYNLGFAGMRNCETAMRFLDWWDVRCMRYSSSVPGAVFTDQHWINLVPTMFRGTEDLIHHGYNVSYANLKGRSPSLHNGCPCVADQPLVFFHFHKFKPPVEELVYLQGHSDQQWAKIVVGAYDLLLAEKSRDSAKLASRFRLMSDGQSFPRLLIEATHRMTEDGQLWENLPACRSLDDVGKWLVSSDVAAPYSRSLAFWSHRLHRKGEFSEMLERYRSDPVIRGRIDNWFHLFAPRALRFPAAWLPQGTMMRTVRRAVGLSQRLTGYPR